MALTYSKVRRGVSAQGGRWTEADVTFDNSYPTGGELIDHAALGIKRVDRVEMTYVVTPESPPVGASSTANYSTKGLVPVPDFTSRTAVKVLLYNSSGEVANASDQSLVVVRLRFIGHE